MGNIKYISAKKGQTAIIIGIVLFHIILILLAYLLLFTTNVIDFEKIAAFLCSGRILKNKITHVIIGIVLIGFLVKALIGFIWAGLLPGSNHSSNNGPSFVYVMNNHNSPGSHGYWW